MAVVLRAYESLNSLADLVTNGNKQISVATKLPKTAPYLRIIVNESRESLTVVFEDESFEVVPEGHQIPWFDVVSIKDLS